MLIGVPKETWAGELRTALVPQNAKKFIELGLSIVVETGSGWRQDQPGQSRGSGSRLGHASSKTERCRTAAS